MSVGTTFPKWTNNTDTRQVKAIETFSLSLSLSLETKASFRLLKVTNSFCPFPSIFSQLFTNSSLSRVAKCFILSCLLHQLTETSDTHYFVCVMSQSSSPFFTQDIRVNNNRGE